MRHILQIRLLGIFLLLGSVLVLSGCSGFKKEQQEVVVPYPTNAPRESHKTTLPAYDIAPPDILVVEVLNAIPKAPYRLREMDVLNVQVQPDMFGEGGMSRQVMIESGGFINLGAPYGQVNVAMRTIQEAEQLVREATQQETATVTLAMFTGRQQIAGEHMVNPDGTITLGSYGSVYVTGMTVEEARNTITSFLEKELESPEVSVSVFAYNSKYYYVVIQGTGSGDRCVKMPVTGNETVLDAISQMEGLSPTSSKRIWIARPVPDGACPQMLPVDWDAVCQRADPRTNYQLMPNDRLFVAEDKWYSVGSQIDKMLSPVERVLGFTMVGTSSARSITFFKRNNYNNY